MCFGFKTKVINLIYSKQPLLHCLIIKLSPHKHCVEVTYSVKHSSLLRLEVNYNLKKFYTPGNWQKNCLP
jgi:hypothetical protein